MTVIGVTPRGCFPGVSRVWEEGQKVCPEFKWVFLEDLRPKSEDVLLFGAWSPAYALPIRRHQGKKFVLWTSPPLQTELQQDEPAYLEMLLGMRQKGLLELIHLDRDSEGVLPGLHFPAPFALPDRPAPSNPREGAALFSLPHPRKNILTQALGTRLAGLKLHINGAEGYRNLLQAMGVDLQDHGWFQSKADYFAALAGRKASLCCFLSESFCYSAAESLAVGTPVVASPVVASNMGLPDWLTCADIDNPKAIAEVIRTILSDWVGWSAKGRECIEATAKANNAGFKKFMEAGAWT